MCIHSSEGKREPAEDGSPGQLSRAGSSGEGRRGPCGKQGGGGSACFLGNWPFPILSLVRLLRWWEPTDLQGGGLPAVGGA